MKLGNIEHLRLFLLERLVYSKEPITIQCPEVLQVAEMTLEAMGLPYKSDSQCISVNGADLNRQALRLEVFDCRDVFDMLVMDYPNLKQCIDLRYYCHSLPEFALFSLSEPSKLAARRLNSQMDYLQLKSNVMNSVNESRVEDQIQKFSQAYYFPSARSLFTRYMDSLFGGELQNVICSLVSQQLAQADSSIFCSDGVIKTMVRLVKNAPTSVQELFSSRVQKVPVAEVREEVFNYLLLHDASLVTPMQRIFPDLLAPYFLVGLENIFQGEMRLPGQLKAPSQVDILAAVKSKAAEKNNYSTASVFKMLREEVENQVFYRQIYDHLLFFYHPRTHKQLLTMLCECSPFSSQRAVDSFFERNSKLIKAFYEFDTVFKAHPLLVQLAEEELQTQIVEGFKHFFVPLICEDFKKFYIKPYRNLIESINNKSNIQQLIHNDRYDDVLQSVEFTDIKKFIIRFFETNVYSYELADLLKSIPPRLAPKYRMDVKPRFSIQNTQLSKSEFHSLVILKNNVASFCFIHIIATLMGEFYDLDKEDKLLQGINHLRNEDLAIMQEQNLDQNELVNKQTVTDKLSWCFQEPVCMFIESGNYQELCRSIQKRYKNTAEQVLSNLQLRIVNVHQLLPKLEKYTLTLFNKAVDKRIDSYNLGLPLFVYTNDQYAINDKALEEQLHRLHAGFICFLLDISPKTKLPDEFALADQFIDKISAQKRSEKSIIDNVKASIKADIYTCDEMGYFLATLFTNQDVNLAPAYLKLDTSKNLNFKMLYDDLSGLLSSQKKKLLKFIFNPASCSNYSVKETLISTQKQPLIEVFSMPHSHVRDLVMNVAAHMILMNENSMYFKILEHYDQMITYQVPGLRDRIGGTFHYDCLIQDSSTENALRVSIRRLSIASYRFFIIFYCTLILLSSLVFNNYKGHGQGCSILSGFETLQQDRFIYVISHISNSISILANVKGFSERGSIGYCNAVMFSFIVRHCNEKQLTPTQLEESIDKHEYDFMITEYCRLILQAEAKSHAKDTGSVALQKLENTNTVEQAERTVQFSTATITEQNPTVPLARRLSMSDRERKNFLKEQKKLAEMSAGAKYLYKERIQRILDVGEATVKFAQTHAEMADFIRAYGRALADVGRLTRLALELKDLIFRQFNGKVQQAEVETRALSKAVVSQFIEAYNFTRHQLLTIQNVCNEQAFPEITEDVSVGQLVLFGSEARDGQSRLSLLDEIILSFCRIVNSIAVGEEMPVATYIDTFCQRFTDDFTGMLDVSCEIEEIANYIQRNLRRVSHAFESLELKESMIVASDTYPKYLAGNREFLELNPDFKLTEDDYDELYLQFDRRAVYERLRPWMNGPTGLVELIATRKLGVELLRGTVADTLVGILDADDIGEEGNLPITKIIMLWSIVQAEE